MVELQRLILLPPPENAGSARSRSAAVQPWTPAQPVPAVPPVRGGTAEDAGNAGIRYRRPWLDESDTAAGRQPAAAGKVATGRIADAAAGIARPLASVAFLAQQIFQEAMPNGLHLEPWAQGIGAYRRAGAAPLLESGTPALFSVAV